MSGLKISAWLVRTREFTPSAADDEVEVAIGFEVLRFGFELQIDAKCAGAILKDVQQSFAPDAAEAVAGRSDDRIAIVHRNVVPIDEIVSNELRALRIVGFKVVERFVGEHDAPAESIVRPVTLDHDHVVRGIAPFQGNREIQSGRTAPKTYGTHRRLLCRNRCQHPAAGKILQA